MNTSGKITVTFKLDEQDFTQGFKFGLNAFYAFCKMRGIQLSELDKVFEDEMESIAAIRDLLFCAASIHNEMNRIPVEFTNLTVGDWLDQMDEDTLAKIIETMNNAKMMGKSLGAPVKTKKKAPIKNT